MRDLILKALQQEERVSGEQLGKSLNISRTAVWKHVNELRKLGYTIDSSPRLGYSFISSTGLLLPEEISHGLDTRIIGKNIVYREEATSTQDVAEEMARNGAEDGTVVICERQTKGRGRKGRSWESPPLHGVYISIILRPSLRPTRVPQVPLVAGVATSRAIKRVTPLQPRIKWPNDIIIGGKKAGGILTEMSSEVDRVNYILLGIGVNVNTRTSLFPEPTRSIATSLAEQCGENVSRVKFVQCLLADMEAVYSQFLSSGFDAIREEWKALNNTIGSRVKVSSGDEELEGEALDIDREGFLLVRKENGDVSRVVSGDVMLTHRLSS
ncbi:MAG: biotin--[acetyl-CoA-carboxylase] ligase [Chloroflexi bacterium]|nr:biotin--[acetyl-CoA-carboxylase] ligase [Chloroflexota bacterium]